MFYFGTVLILKALQKLKKIRFTIVHIIYCMLMCTNYNNCQFVIFKVCLKVKKKTEFCMELMVKTIFTKNNNFFWIL